MIGLPGTGVDRLHNIIVGLGGRRRRGSGRSEEVQARTMAQRATLTEMDSTACREMARTDDVRERRVKEVKGRMDVQ